MNSKYFKSEPSIVISNVDLDINEKYVEKVVQNMGRVSCIVIDKRVGSKGNYYNRITIHFDFWYENASTVKPRSALLQGKKININHNVSSVWVAKALNLQADDDMRPYSVRRLDDKLCEQDAKQGFKDRRLKALPSVCDDIIVDVVIDMSIPVWVIAPALGQKPKPIILTPKPNEESQEEAKKEEEEEAKKKKEEEEEAKKKKKAEEAKKKQEAEQAKKEEGKKKHEEAYAENKAKQEALPPLIKNPLMVIKMGHYFRSYDVFEISDHMYRTNIQFIRDQIEFAKEIQEEDDTPNVDYGEFQTPPTRKRVVVVA